MLSLMSPLLVQYSVLQMSPAGAAAAAPCACAAEVRPESTPAPTPMPAALRMVRRASVDSLDGLRVVSSLMASSTVGLFAVYVFPLSAVARPVARCKSQASYHTVIPDATGRRGAASLLIRRRANDKPGYGQHIR